MVSGQSTEEDGAREVTEEVEELRGGHSGNTEEQRIYEESALALPRQRPAPARRNVILGYVVRSGLQYCHGKVFLIGLRERVEKAIRPVVDVVRLHFRPEAA